MKTLSMLVLAIGAVLFPAVAPAQPLDDAHRAFAEGRYHDSTVGYQNVLDAKGYSAPVLFDLGNSYFREGDPAEAILAYKRAQWLSPDDPDIAANLQYAQKQAGALVSEPQSGEKLSEILSPSAWAWIGCAAWTLLCASILGRVVWSQRRGLFFMTGLASVFVLIAAIAAMVISFGELSQAVVVDKKASALISPFPAAQAVFSPLAGETVAVKKSYDDFLLVKDAAGHTGWVNKAQITPIIPPSNR